MRFSDFDIMVMLRSLKAYILSSAGKHLSKRDGIQIAKFIQAVHSSQPTMSYRTCRLILKAMDAYRATMFLSMTESDQQGWYRTRYKIVQDMKLLKKHIEWLRKQVAHDGRVAQHGFITEALDNLFKAEDDPEGTDMNYHRLAHLAQIAVEHNPFKVFKNGSAEFCLHLRTSAIDKSQRTALQMAHFSKKPIDTKPIINKFDALRKWLKAGHRYVICGFYKNNKYHLYSVTKAKCKQITARLNQTLDDLG